MSGAELKLRVRFIPMATLECRGSIMMVTQCEQGHRENDLLDLLFGLLHDFSK